MPCLSLHRVDQLASGKPCRTVPASTPEARQRLSLSPVTRHGGAHAIWDTPAVGLSLLSLSATRKTRLVSVSSAAG